MVSFLQFPYIRGGDFIFNSIIYCFELLVHQLYTQENMENIISYIVYTILMTIMNIITFYEANIKQRIGNLTCYDATIEVFKSNAF